MVCLLVCSVEIMNTLQHIQVLSTCKCVEEKKKNGMPKTDSSNNANLKMGLQMCMTFKSSVKSHCFQHVIIYICMLKYSPHVGDLVILFMDEVIIFIVS